jgi:outer membrane receptor for ferric coprogen and ferric-rhodotorulic acid
MNKSAITLCSLLLPVSNLVLLAQLATAQPIPPTQSVDNYVNMKSGVNPMETGAPDMPDGEIVNLSPFVVQSERDTGYVATDSLAGTRFRTPLKDIAASISVVTKDLMDDLAANTLEDLLVYTVGTEVMGVGGNFSGSEQQTAAGTAIQSYENQRDAAATTTRVRGLAAADKTRNYFLSPYIPMDGYNTQSATVNRGANAILFGFGSPAGIIENSLIAPVFKNRGNARFSFGSYDSYRFSFDLERVLLKNKLSVRVAMLDDNRRYEQNFSFRDQERYFAAVTYKPFNYTSIRVNGEHGHIDQRMPRIDPPIDCLSSWWWSGQPVRTNLQSNVRLRMQDYAGFPGSEALTDRIVNGAQVTEGTYLGPHNLTGQGGNYAYNPLLVHNDVNTAYPDYAFISNVTQNNAPGYNSNINWRFLAPRSTADYALNILPATSDASILARYSYARAKQLTDRSVFDYREQLLDGPNSGVWIDFDTANVVLEQLFLGGDAGIELVYDRQHSTSSMNRIFNGWHGNNIHIDTMISTMDGLPNPNFGRPYFASNGMYNHIENLLETYRATAFFRHDFTKKGRGFLRRLLGVQNFSGMYSYYDRVQNTRSGYDAATDGSLPSTQADPSLGDYLKVSHMVYIGPSLYGRDSLAGTNLQGSQTSLLMPKTINVLTVNANTDHQWATPEAPIYTYRDGIEYVTNTVRRDTNKVASTAVVWQGYWWDGMLVSTAGWRKDTDQSAQGNSAGRGPSNGTKPLTAPVMPDERELTRETLSYGLVLHAPARWLRRLPGTPGLSFYYNSSENFDVGAGTRLDMLGKYIDPQQGETEEYGIRLSGLNNRFNMRITWYETDQNNISDPRISGRLRYVAELEKLIMQTTPKALLDASGYVGADSASLTPMFKAYLDAWKWRGGEENTTHGGRDYLYSAPSPLAATTQSRSKGMEIEAVYNPAKNWRILLNVTKQKAFRGETEGQFDALVAERMGEWAKIPDRDIGSWTVQNYAAANIIGPVNTAKLSNGKWVDELREWRVNVVTNYTFNRISFLKGWSVGGAVRWEDKVGIGYPVINNSEWVTGMPDADKYIIDLKHPFMGPSATTFDAWLSHRTKIWKGIDWKIQLNIRNLFNRNLMIPVYANPVALNDTRNYDVATWRIGAGRTFEITSTFSF